MATNTNPFESPELTEYFQKGMEMLTDTQQKMGDWLASDWMTAGQSAPDAMTPDSLMAGFAMPRFDNLFGVDRKVMAFVQAAVELTQANAELQSLVGKTWIEAYQRFTTMEPRDSTFKGAMDSWFDYANNAMLHCQRSGDFLSAQRKCVNASTAFREAQRDLMEVYQEKNNMPTRTEVDDLSKSVYDLKRELRALKRQMNEAGLAARTRQTAGSNSATTKEDSADE